MRESSQQKQINSIDGVGFGTTVKGASPATEFVRRGSKPQATELIARPSKQGKTEKLRNADGRGKTEVLNRQVDSGRTEILGRVQSGNKTEVINRAQSGDKTEVINRAKSGDKTEVIKKNTPGEPTEVINKVTPNGKTEIINPPAPVENPPLPPVPDVQSTDSTLPVGWLVAISGPMLGQTFTLNCGTNPIGRSRNNRICLPSDEYISRAHMIVSYSHKSRSFYVAKATEQSQPTTLSDGRKITTTPTPLEAGEILRMSPLTSLRFVPFSNRFFDWDYQN